MSAPVHSSAASGAPTVLERDHAPQWHGASLEPTVGLHELLEADSAGLADAARAATARLARRDLLHDRSITAADVPLPGLDQRLQAVAEEVVAGVGFAVLRGLPVEDLDEQECMVLLRGLTARLGAVATQSRDGQLLRHVRATGASLGDGRVRGHQTAQRLWFHTDGADAAVLLCRRAAATGGLSRLAAAGTVHNHMLQVDPGLAAELYQPFHFHMAGGHVPGGPPTFISPIFAVHGGRFSCRFVRHTLLETPAITGVPLPVRAVDAFDLLEETADRAALNMVLQPGDLQVVNNHVVLHSRTAYTDPPQRDAGRHLLRTWVRFPQAPDRRPGLVDRALRGGWLTDDIQRQAAQTWTPPTTTTSRPTAAGGSEGARP